MQFYEVKSLEGFTYVVMGSSFEVLAMGLNIVSEICKIRYEFD